MAPSSKEGVQDTEVRDSVALAPRLGEGREVRVALAPPLGEGAGRARAWRWQTLRQWREERQKYWKRGDAAWPRGSRWQWG